MAHKTRSISSDGKYMPVDLEIVVAALLYIAAAIGLLLYPVLRKAHLLINSALIAALATIIILFKRQILSITATLVCTILILILSELFSDYKE